MRRPLSLFTMFTALLCVGTGVFSGCDEEKGILVPNNPPVVLLTAAPPDSGISGYDVEFQWEGRDSDGEVDHFIYAIDPPDLNGTEDSVWTRTDAYSGSFVFESSHFDTLYHWKYPQIAKNWHLFAVKAVDDMGAVSEPDYVAFNAANIAPRTQITTPPPEGSIDGYMGVPQHVGLGDVPLGERRPRRAS